MSTLFISFFLGVMLVGSRARGNDTNWKFNFDPATPKTGFLLLTPADVFTSVRGFGFDLDAEVKRGDGCVTSGRPFFFSVASGEGNFEVTLRFGDATSATTNTVKAEMRRLMLERVVTKPGEFVTHKICLNVRTPEIAEGDHVRLKQREKDGEMINWDGKLTLEFNGTRPGVAAIAIERVKVPTVFLTGDSTVCDQPLEPWNSWGQMLPRFFKPGIAIANHAQSGESIKSSLGAKRFEKVFSEMKPGDWLFVQFGHNDMKDKATNALATYTANLRRIVGVARKKGGTPVLVTSMERKIGVDHDTLAGYPDAVRTVAKEEGVALIDLHAMSKTLYRALGTNLDGAFQDGTHHNNYGSYEIAKCIAQGIRQNNLPLAAFLVDDFNGFDPAHPDRLAVFDIPESPMRSEKKPDGS